MLKQRLLKIFFALALLTAITGSAGIMADSLGFASTPQVSASCAGGGGHC